MSKNGKAFTCLRSIREFKGGETKSNIVSTLTPGSIVTVPRTHTHHLVTEFGAVSLKGKSYSERARLLISIAHQGFRDQLEKEARRSNIFL